MITIEQALDFVRKSVVPLAPRRMRLDDLLGLRLAEDISSTVDSPPFDKSLVDGFAIAINDDSPTLRIAEVVFAGAVPTKQVTPGATIRLMTGAPLPAGADAVVKWEDCRQIDDDTMANPAAGQKPGACVLKRGAAFHAGQRVLAAGKKLGPLEIALLAEIGQAEVAATPRPRVGMLPTGDELVEAHEACGPGQIRNSNGPMLIAALKAFGATPVDLGVARDDPGDLREKIAQGLAQCDAVLVSGGVSAGIKDLAPGIFADLGVRELFHQVRVKPGKPLWFGVHESPTRRTLAFGLPGNPVSTLVSFKLFVEPAIAALAGAEFAPPTTRKAMLSAKFTHRGKRPTYQPCRAVGEDAKTGQSLVEPLDWKGSADLATLTRADCLAAMPEGDYELAAGDAVDVLML